MFTMAMIGLLWALMTLKDRQSRHPQNQPGLDKPRSYQPAELPALGYLPGDTNVLAGIHLADLLKTPLGAKFLETPLPSLLAFPFNTIEKRAGMKLDAIDHVVLGTTLKNDIPQLTLVLQTRRPYTLQDMARVFPHQPIKHHQRPLFRFSLGVTGGGYLWCADERTLVMLLRPDAVKIEDMDHIPAAPPQASAGLAKPLRDILENRLRSSVLWVAGNLDRLPPRAALPLFGRLPAGPTELLKNIQSFGMGMLLQEDLTLIGAFEARSLPGAGAWKKFLETQARTGFKSRKIIGPGPGDTWINLQIRAEPEGLRGMLEAGQQFVPRWK